MSERCGNCGALNPVAVETCERCGALLAAYRSPAGATEVMPEPDFDTRPDAASVTPPSAPPRPLATGFQTEKGGASATPEPITLVERASFEPEPVPEIAASEPGEVIEAALVEPVEPAPPATPPVMIRPDPVSPRSSPTPVIRPSTGQRPAIRRSPSAPEVPLSGSGEEFRLPAAQLTRPPPSNRLVAGGIGLVLVSCIMFGVGSSPGVSDAFAYLALCLGPLGIIGLIVGAGLSKLRRTNLPR